MASSPPRRYGASPPAGAPDNRAGDDTAREAAQFPHVVLIHGMWGGGWYWDRFQEYLESRGFRCMAPNLRHHDIAPDAPAPPGLGETSLLDYADDLERSIRALERPPILIGHSMGGLLAQILAARGLASAAVLVTPAAPARVVAIRWSVLRTFAGVLFRWRFWKRPHKLSYGKAEYGMMLRLPPNERRYLYDRGVWESGRAAAEIGFWFLGLRGARVDPSRVNCPLLVIAASEDNITPAKVVRNVAMRYPTTRDYREYPGHAHWIIREPGWQRVADDIIEWIRENA